MLRFSARANREIVKCESWFTGKSVFGGCLKWLDFVWKRITELRWTYNLSLLKILYLNNMQIKITLLSENLIAEHNYLFLIYPARNTSITNHPI